MTPRQLNLLILLGRRLCLNIFDPTLDIALLETLREVESECIAQELISSSSIGDTQI